MGYQLLTTSGGHGYLGGGSTFPDVLPDGLQAIAEQNDQAVRDYAQPITRGQLTDGSDLNALYTNAEAGSWSLISGLSYGNAPAGLSSTAVLEVQRGSGGGVVQRVTMGARMWFREATDANTGVWSAWTEVESVTGAQAKADAAESDAKNYAANLAYGTSLDATESTVAGFVDGSVGSGLVRDAIVVNRRKVPTYAGARVRTWDPSLHLYNGESPTLRSLRLGVAAARAGKSTYRVACLGDSKTFGSSLPAGQSMAVDSYPAQVMNLLGGTPGLIVGNVGDTRWGSIAGFTNAASTSQNYFNGSAAVAKSVTLTTDKPHTGFRLHGFIGVGGSVTVTIDGGAAQTWTIPTGGRWQQYVVTGLANTTHTIKVDAAAATNFSFMGAELTYDTPVLTVTNAGRSSSTAANWLPQDWSTLWASVMNGPGITVPSAVLLNIGTNTGTSTLDDITTVATNVVNLGIPLMLCAFGGIAINTTYNPKRVRLYDIADSLDVPLLDFTDVIGDYATANAAGLMADTVHENGRGYALEATAVVRALALA